MSTKSFYISLLILLVTILAMLGISSRGNPVVVKTNLENLPMEIAGFKATSDSFSQSVYDELNADKHIYRHYSSQDGRKVDLYIGYYGTAKGVRTSHNPYGCLPGAGWGITKAHDVKLKPRSYPQAVKVNYILAQDGDTFDVVLHWYQSQGNKVFSNGFQQNIQRFIGRIFYNRNDGAFVRISTFSDRNGIEKSKDLVQFFAENILTLLPRYWPLEE